MKRETLKMANCEYCGGSGEVYDVSNNRPRSCPLCGNVAIGARAQWYGRVDSIAGPQIVPRPIDTYTGADGKQHPIVEL